MHNATKLFREVKQRGYQGGSSQLRALVGALAKRRTGAGVCALRDRAGRAGTDGLGHAGAFAKHRLYAFALTLSYSRMRYVEFTQRQDAGSTVELSSRLLKNLCFAWNSVLLCSPRERGKSSL